MTLDIEDEDDESVAGARLKPGTLARFAEGLTWRGIYDMTGGRRRTWWRAAVVEAEQRGLLEWSRETRMWTLTEAGREHVRNVT